MQFAFRFTLAMLVLVAGGALTFWLAQVSAFGLILLPFVLFVFICLGVWAIEG